MRIDFSFRFMGSTRFMVWFFAALAIVHLALTLAAATAFFAAGHVGPKALLVAICLLLTAFYALASLAFDWLWRQARNARRVAEDYRKEGHG